jgi:coenzyme F420-reducing hydrogenase delta subunit
MYNIDYPTYAIASMTVAQFKQLKRAVRVLCSAGVPHKDAVDIILTAHNKREHYRQTA